MTQTAEKTPAASTPSTTSSPTPPTTEKRKQKAKNQASFWRAVRYLNPYRKIVIISIVSAFGVGLAFAGGLGTMLPIMRVLINGENVQTWLDRQIVESRLGVKLTDASAAVTVVQATKSGIAGRNNIEPGDTIVAANDTPEGHQTLADLATASSVDALVTGRAGIRPITLGPLKPVRWYTGIARGVISHFPTQPVGAVGAVLAVIVGISLVGNFLRFFQEYYSDKAAILAINDIRRRLYDHVLHVPLSFFGKAGTSDVTSRLVADCNGLQEGFKTVLGQSIQQPINAALAFILALSISWRMTLFIVVFAPVMVTIIRKFGKKMRRASRKALQSSSTMLGQIESSLVGIRVVKGANAERFERRRYARIMTVLSGEQIHMSLIDAYSAPVMELLTLLVVCVVVMYATYLVRIRGTLQPEQFFVVMACLASIAEAMRRFGKVNNALQKSGAAAARIFETLDLPVERPRHLLGNDSRPRIKIPAIAREVRFDRVSFGYLGTSAAAVDDVSLVVPAGSSVAIVGRNGSGKTTLLALLPRFYDPSAGRVSIDGVDVRDATLASLRGQISIVTQDSVIFPGTIQDNIRYGNPRAPREAVIAAAKRAFAHDFILEKPLGYDTPLDGLGGQLSGGQKQRINIARAILRASPILVLDEATSQVDAESEHLIQQAIEGLMHERTTFVIAHRFSTILSANSIVVMDRGRIVGQGKHDELLANCPTYAQLYERQLFRPTG